MARPIITLENIAKRYREDEKHFTALHSVNLSVHEGEFFVMVGPSGCGKSTLLRIITGLEKEYQGSVTFDPSITPADISFVFQNFALLPWMTVFENVALGLTARGISKEEQKKIIDPELKKLGLSEFAHNRPKDLSGGMRQRVGIARAMVTNPKVIFMDEPFSELDSFTAEDLRQDLLAIWEEKKPTIVMVTHIVPEAIQLADRIAVFTPQPGTIEKILPVHLPRPRDKRSPDFFELEDAIYKAIKP